MKFLSAFKHYKDEDIMNQSSIIHNSPKLGTVLNVPQVMNG